MGLGDTCGQGNTTNTPAVGSGQLYVSNAAGNSLERFASATTVSSNVVPTATINGSLTQLSTPGYLGQDITNDVLYVPNAGNNSIDVFAGASQANGNISPSRQIFGTATQLNRPVQVELDTVNNRLYVANAGNNSVLVFENATTTQGPIAPSRTISGAGTQITGISSLHVDTANDLLWVVNPTTNSLLVFSPASSANGSPNPVRIVSGNNTGLVTPAYLLETGSTLFISCAGSIVRFAGANALSGNIAPAAVINGTNTGLITPTQLAYNSGTDELYTADSGSSTVSVFSTASTAFGNVFPNRTLTGASTGFSGLTGLALDLTR
jgi:DNA-binding beta-propeller fold protein YncE